jgi:hypothetical protein
MAWCALSRKLAVEQLRRLTFEFTRKRRLAKPAVARQVQRRARPHASSSGTDYSGLV